MILGITAQRPQAATREAAASATLAALVLSATGSLLDRAAFAGVLTDATLSATGGQTNQGSVSVTLGALVLSATGSLEDRAAFAGVLTDATLSATAILPSYVLLEDGSSYLLQEDGTSKVLLE